jgi:serine/threonine protein kinase
VHANVVIPLREPQTVVEPQLRRGGTLGASALARPACASALACPGWCEALVPTSAVLVPRPESIAPGTLVGGRYLLDALVGRGGMGDVYRATVVDEGRWVALKVMRAEHALDRELRARFSTEVRAMQRVSHANVVGFVDAGTHQGAPYLVMEYVDGANLSTVLKASPRGRLAIRRALDLLEMICEGVQAIHDAGVVHGDIKTGNIFLDAAGRAVVGDFGLARPWSSCCTLPLGKTAGTPAYMAPELITGATVAPAPASDVYALGALAYRLLTGKLPFDAQHAGDVFECHVLETAPRPSASRPELPAAVDEVILRALAKDPAARHPDAKAFAAALRDAIAPRRPSRPWSQWLSWNLL